MKQPLYESATDLREEALSTLFDGLSPKVRKPPPTLIDYFRSTVHFQPDPWQYSLANQLQRCAHETGVKLLVHAPPQYGKSSLVSRTFPAWLIGMNPLIKIVLACFKEERAMEFGNLIIDLLRSNEFRHDFPDVGNRIPDLTRADRFITAARGALHDTLTTFTAVGMQSGLVSRGMDCLVGETKVITPTGVRTIKEMVSSGEGVVLGYDHDDHLSCWCSIEAVKESQSDEIVELTTIAGRKIRLTADHRVYVPGLSYTQARCLRVGDPLITDTGDLPHVTTDTVAGIEFLCDRGVPVYDLQIEGTCNFFAGEILVHNCLINDDIYKSAEDAFSPLVNDRAWHWREKTVQPRVDDKTNEVIMFHRYHATDLIGRILDRDGLKKDGGKWIMLRYPAIADDNEDGTDPTGRKPGELLSGIRSREYLMDFRLNDPVTFEAQFQGNPNAVGGMYFPTHEIEIIAEVPLVKAFARGWDPAYTKDSGDHSCGALVTVDAQGNLIICDVWRRKVTGPEVRTAILQHCIDDPPNCIVGVEDHQSNKYLIDELQSPGLVFKVSLQPIDVAGRTKWERAMRWALLMGRGKVKLVKGEWNADFLKELSRFKNKRTDIDDQIDAVSVAFEALGSEFGTTRYQKPIVWGTPEYYQALHKDQHGSRSGKKWYE